MRPLSIVWTVFCKEARDILRDRRTLFMTFFIPLFLYPLCVLMMGSWAGKKAREFQDRPITVAILAKSPEAQETAMEGLREGVDKVEFKLFTPADDPVGTVKRGEVEMVLVVPENFPQLLASGQSAKMQAYFKATNEGRSARARLNKAVQSWRNRLLHQRLEKAGLSPEYITPLEIADQNVATDVEMQAQMAGGIISYLVVFLSLVGCMAPAIDLGAGEKERHTLETLLTAPTDFLHIVAGKLLIVVLMGTVSAALALVGMLVVPLFGGELPASLQALGGNLITPKTAVLAFVIVAPQVLLVGSCLLLLSFLSRSAKEANSLTSPILMLCILVLMASFTPGLKLTILTAMVPLLNVSLALQELMAGTLSFGLGALTAGSLLAYSAVVLRIGASLVPREAALFRI